MGVCAGKPSFDGGPDERRIVAYQAGGEDVGTPDHHVVGRTGVSREIRDVDLYGGRQDVTVLGVVAHSAGQIVQWVDAGAGNGPVLAARR